MKSTKIKKILVVYTGGTFGMREAQKGLELPSLNEKQLKKWLSDQVPEMMKMAACDVDILFNLDSCQFEAHHWFELAAHLLKKSKSYDGVIVLHGTDTLAYTAAALSYLLSPSPVPIVITGAQKPLSTLRSDARQNFISALEIASSAPQPLQNRVMVAFHDELFLGSRVRKKSATHYAAFESPRFPRLASIGSDIEYHEVIHHLPKLSRQSALLKSFQAQKTWQPKPQILMTTVTPEFCSSIFTSQMLQKLDGILLTLYPSGTAPTQQENFLNFLERAQLAEIPILTITEREDEIKNLNTYASGRELMKYKAFWCKDLTPEAAFVKLWFMKELYMQKPNQKNSFYKSLRQDWVKTNLSDESSPD